MPRECSNIRRSDRSHNSERARSLSGPELPPLLSYDVHKRDLRYRKISSSRFRFEWRDSSGKSQLSWRARYLLITPEIRRVDKEFEWMARIKSFFFSILLANILVLVVLLFCQYTLARVGGGCENTSMKLCFLFFLSFFFPQQPIIIIITGRSNSINTMAGRKWVESVGQCVITI